MKALICPSCGAEVRFQSAVSVFAVCKYCASMLVRRDLDVESIGKMAVLQNDASPLQIGTQGKFNKVNFTLIGRQVLKWSDGSWNEWFMQFDDSSHGWLAEAQGFYMVSFEALKVSTLPPLAEIKPDTTVTINNQLYQVEDIKEAICSGSQGELPFKAQFGRKSTSIDCTGDNNKFASLDYSEDGVRAYTGQYIDFDNLKLTLLRQIDGW